MLYVEPIYRPPSEAGSLLIQATIGCASAAQGHCYFCGSWLIDRQIPQKKFRVRPARDVMKDLDEARGQTGPGVRRIFLLDSNAMIMRTGQLEKISRHAYTLFPSLERVSVYACANDILRKSDEDLKRIRQAGISLLYIGLESGSEQILELHNKGVTAEDTVRGLFPGHGGGFRDLDHGHPRAGRPEAKPCPCPGHGKDPLQDPARLPGGPHPDGGPRPPGGGMDLPGGVRAALPGRDHR